MTALYARPDDLEPTGTCTPAQDPTTGDTTMSEEPPTPDDRHRTPPPAAPPPPPIDAPAASELAPAAPTEREPILDVLRGFALLGILLINIELMRGPLLYEVLGGEIPPPSEGLDRVLQFAVGWLAQGKFISSFAIMFGLGAAMIAGRALAKGHRPGGILAKRYAWLLVIGIAHMVLLFPGDILFIYGLTGLILLVFLQVKQRTALIWSGALIGLVTVVTVGFSVLGAAFAEVGKAAADDPFTAAFQDFFAARAEAAVAAHVDGTYLDVIGVQAIEAAIVQTGQLFVIPWVLGLFLLGFVIGRTGIVDDVAAFRPQLRRAALVGLGLGLPLSFAMGAVDPIVILGGAAGAQVNVGLLALITLGQQLGAPILAVGYLAAVALLSLRFGTFRPLAAVGRMALTAYLGQSLLTLIVFAGFSQYGQLGPAEAMLVVLGVWLVLLIVCPLWLRAFRFGPVEWLWRTLTYGRGQPLRRRRDVQADA